MLWKTTDLRGVIIDSESGEPIPGATIQIESKEIGVAADSRGEFEFPEIEPGMFVLIIRSMGYQTKSIKVDHPSDDWIIIEAAICNYPFG
jgi:hypothetical protein